MFFSLIIPVYNRPDEIDELLESLTKQTYPKAYEIIIVEDGSVHDCKHIVEKYTDLDINYFVKENSGPGDSRNYGMKNAKGNYFIILDSDCVLPKNYLQNVESSLQLEYVDCFGGPDAATDNFSDIQKAINFTMTSFFTTGGIRGGGELVSKFQPRSFNMGISENAFKVTGGFGSIHPGEDPDLSIRLWKLGFETKLIKNAYVFHKRRIDWQKFYTQVHKFGLVRPILNLWHPDYAKITFWFPTAFLLGFLFSFLLFLFSIPYFIFFYLLYFIIIFGASYNEFKSIKISFYTLKSLIVQFYGYGTGFLESYVKLNILKQKPEIAFPNLFFKK